MLVGELVLSMKTLEIELKAERTRSEAMRHNLRALASASGSNSGKQQETARNITGAYKKTAQSPRDRYLEGGSDLNLQYRNYRHASAGRSGSAVEELNSRPSFLDQRSRSNTTVPGQFHSPKQTTPTAASAKHPPGPRTHQTQVSIKEKERVGAIFTDAASKRQHKDIFDPVDSFNLDDIHIDSPFDDAPGFAPSLHFPSIKPSEIPILATAAPKSAANGSSSHLLPPAESSIPASSSPREKINASILPSDLPRKHVEDGSSAIQDAVESAPTLIASSSDAVASSSDSVSRTDSGESMTLHQTGSHDADAEMMGEEAITVGRVLESLQQALFEGTRQKIELERTRKQLIVQNMGASLPLSVSQVSSSGDSGRKDVASPAPESKPSSRRLLLKRIKSKPGNMNVSHPIGLRVGSYRAELDEFERIFCLTQDFINIPSAAHRAEEANFPEAFKRRFGVLKESLDYDADFSGCDLFVIYGFILEYLCKSTRLNLSNNKIAEIPSQLRKFDKLEELNLNSNSIVRVPGAIAHLKSLRVLQFSNNLVSDIPTELAYLTQLEILDLAENQISEVPKHIGLLQSLRYFNISKNPIQTLPSELSLCSKLTHLIANTCFLKKVPKELPALSELEFLDLTHNSLKELPSGMGVLTKLRTLKVEENQLTELPVGLGLCTTLLSEGEFLWANNPWNPKTMSALLNGEQTMTVWMAQKVTANQKQLSKLAAPPLPKVPTVPIYKSISVDNERWTLQEKMLCCGDWVSNTLDKYLRPALSSMSTILSNVTDVESPSLLKLVHTLRQVTTLVWRSEDLLKPAPFADVRTFEDDVPLNQIRSIINAELMNLDAITRSLVPIIRSAAISEKIEDTVTVVNIVHFARDLLFVLVLDEVRGTSSSIPSTATAATILPPRSAASMPPIHLPSTASSSSDITNPVSPRSDTIAPSSTSPPTSVSLPTADTSNETHNAASSSPATSPRLPAKPKISADGAKSVTTEHHEEAPESNGRDAIANESSTAVSHSSPSNAHEMHP